MTSKHTRFHVPLKNARHEIFARNRSKGMSAVAAYAAAGYKPHRQSASRLVTNADIQGRVAFLQAQAAGRGVENIVNQLDADRALARRNNQASAAIQATMGKARVLGLIVDWHVAGAKRVEDMNEDELRTLLGNLETEEGAR